MAGSRVDVAARLSPVRASRGTPRALLNPTASTTSTTEPAPPTTRPKPKPVYRAAAAKPAPARPASSQPRPATASNSAPAGAQQTPPMPAPGGNSNSQEGRASWYDAKYHQSNPWICAHKTIPKGTVLTVTNVNTGAHITCEVGDRGPYVEGRILDLSKYAFSKLANPSSGLVWVRITW